MVHGQWVAMEMVKNSCVLDLLNGENQWHFLKGWMQSMRGKE